MYEFTCMQYSSTSVLVAGGWYAGTRVLCAELIKMASHSEE